MKKIFTLASGLLLMSAIGAKAEPIVVYVNDYYYNQVASPFETELTLDEEGNYVIADFFNSGEPVKFTFDKPEADKWGNITFTGYLDRASDADPYLMDAEGFYLTCCA